MYPYFEYINAEISQFPALENPMKRLNELIDTRYRQNGYGIYWVAFSEENNPRNYDKTAISPLVRIEASDKIIPCGVSFQTMFKYERYAESSFIRARLPEEIEEVKLGGFHQYDCVSRIGKYLYEQGIPTLVDEDTTNFFFSTLSIHGSIPDTREFTMEGFGYRVLDDDDNVIRNEIIARQKKEPWFVQPARQIESVKV